MLRIADLVEKHAEELASLETWNNGKPYEQALKTELPMVVRLFHYYAGEITKLNFISHQYLLLKVECRTIFSLNIQVGLIKSMD